VLRCSAIRAWPTMASAWRIFCAATVHNFALSGLAADAPLERLPRNQLDYLLPENPKTAAREAAFETKDKSR